MKCHKTHHSSGVSCVNGQRGLMFTQDILFLTVQRLYSQLLY